MTDIPTDYEQMADQLTQELGERIRSYAETTNQTVHGVLTEVISRGLESMEAEQQQAVTDVVAYEPDPLGPKDPSENWKRWMGAEQERRRRREREARRKYQNDHDDPLFDSHRRLKGSTVVSVRPGVLPPVPEDLVERLR